MSILDKVIASVTPPESAEARGRARAKAENAAGSNDWLAAALDHHTQILDAFAAVKSADAAESRRTAQQHLGLILMGHAIAEEAVLYPALADAGETGHADMGYTEQAMVKMQMAALEKLDPMTDDYIDKLEHIEGAVRHHMFEEEGTWFLELKEKAVHQGMITERFLQEFDRYVGDGSGA